jgi:hypothetical protein
MRRQGSRSGVVDVWKWRDGLGKWDCSKEARRVKPWLSELDVPEWQELAGDRLGWRKMLKSIKIRT